MKTSKSLAAPTLEPPQPGQPMPFTPDPDAGPGPSADDPIEPPPPAVRRTLKARLHRHGRSQPIVVASPWE